MASQSQPNGVSTASAGTSQTVPNTQAAGSSQPPASSQQPQASQQSQQQGPSQPASASDPRPRDARLIELLLTSQGVTADALHLAGDPYVTQAGSKPSASSGATATAPGEAPITANAVKLAISARLAYQFRGGSAGGGISKEHMQELARDRNKVSLPKIVPNEWGVRLPSERFVLTGTSWGLKDLWEGDEDASDDEDMDVDQRRPQQPGGDAMEGVEGPNPEDVGGDGVEGGTVEDVFGDDVDEEMAEE
ncbi:hypothetical protein ACCO45_006958 [Purpureocillium lilacinum]|uniref:Uncharacterized protein n=1 Tax=Purpureocillium lilacinum TaxID=33203 RepID=A0ACC4DTP5_PURLI